MGVLINENAPWQKNYTSWNTRSAENRPSLVLDSNKNIYVAYTTEGIIKGETGALSPIDPKDIVITAMASNGRLLWKTETDTGVRQEPLIKFENDQYANNSGWNTNNDDNNPEIIIDNNNQFLYVVYNTEGDTIAVPETTNEEISIILKN